jgi:homoserine O-succinyltransferase
MTWHFGTLLSRASVDDSDAAVIGLVNNMSPKAMRTTERQFRDVLHSAAGDRPVKLELFTLHENQQPRSSIPDPGKIYRSLDELWPMRLDGLIVTGMEPRTATLREEPGWRSLTRLADWANLHRVPTVWSCLAAHAIVLHLANIDRVRLPRKLSGVYTCTANSPAHPFVTGAPAEWLCPHSRYNGLPEYLLRARGYEIISRSDEAGVDMFGCGDSTPFLFCQGHPEYGPDVLIQEYVRDLKRYLDGEKAAPEDVPTGCVDDETEWRLRTIREGALSRRHADILAETRDVARNARFISGWQSVAAKVYGNWLTSIVAHRCELTA